MKQTFLLAAIAICSLIAAPIIFFTAAYHYSIGYASKIGGTYVPGPGWPMGISEVYLGRDRTGVLDEVTLIKAVRRQRFNFALDYLSLSGHPISAGVADAILDSGAHEVALTDCEVTTEAMLILLQSSQLKRVFCDDALGSELAELATEIDSSVHIVSPINRTLDTVSVHTANPPHIVPAPKPFPRPSQGDSP